MGGTSSQPVTTQNGTTHDQKTGITITPRGNVINKNGRLIKKGAQGPMPPMGQQPQQMSMMNPASWFSSGQPQGAYGQPQGAYGVPPQGAYGVPPQGVQGPPGYRPYGGKKNGGKKRGGQAPVDYRYGVEDPSNKVMNWAVTANAPTPTEGMGRVAHGGKRKTHRHKKSKSHKNKSRKHKSRKNKSKKH